MKKILELLFCLVALIALLICTKYAENVEDVQNEVVAVNADGQSSVDNVAMVSNQE